MANFKIPKTLPIKGKTWNIEYKWNLRHEGKAVDGLCDFGNRTIFIDRLVPKESKPTIFIHEFVHAVLFESYLYQSGGLDGFAEEVVCSSIASALLDSFNIKLKRGVK